jgi:hypothetical protein
MIVDDKETQPRGQPVDWSSDLPPAGFLITEGRSFILVGADHVGRFARRCLMALRSLSRFAARRS